MLNKTQDDMKREINDQIAQGSTLDDIKDRSGEFIDGWLPVYNNEIIKEWQDMPSEYDNRGANELGYQESELNIVRLMSLDLYLYYTDLFNEVIEDIEDDIAHDQEVSA